MYLRLLTACAWMTIVWSIPADKLYPFGTIEGDVRLPAGDDLSSDEIRLTTPVAFYNSLQKSLYVNLNGHISFETELPNYSSDFTLPSDYKILAAFLSDVDTRLTGSVYYRETQDEFLLRRATKEINKYFPSHYMFRPRNLFIATWNQVGHYDRAGDKTNSYQVVIASDGRDSFANLLYVDGGLNWVKGDGKGGNINPDNNAQAGFDAGDGRRSMLLPASGRPEVKNLNGWSNIGRRGEWWFRIGNTGDENVQSPKDPNDKGREEPDRPGGSGGEGGQKTCHTHGPMVCSINANCIDYSKGFCCECGTGYFGNGKHCITTEKPQRLSGYVKGFINGVEIKKANLHSYIVTKEGRTYYAISRVPPSLGISMQSLFVLGSGIGWVFAMPTAQAKNGFMITGGTFNRTVTVKFLAEGQEVKIKDHASGDEVADLLTMTTEISGSIPNIPASASVKIDDYKEEYRRVSPGVIKSFSTKTYRVDGVPYRHTVDQTITYNECTAKQRTAADIDTFSLAVDRSYISFDKEHQIVRYTMQNKISPLSKTDPCSSGHTCGENSNCIPTGLTYRCECEEGFTGDGRRCDDIDECLASSHNCHANALCVNTLGSFQCRCQPGYRGDGYNCVREDNTCGAVTCDSNARCVFDNDLGRPRCECLSGFTGDGITCKAGDCRVANNCDLNAECMPNHETRRYECTCKEGFSGDGLNCEANTCDILKNCNANAKCLFDRNSRLYKCQCNPGFTGDGLVCREEDCRSKKDCDFNGECVRQSATSDKYVCRCKVGYQGDGKICRSEVIPCNQVNNCDVNADCEYEASVRGYRCSCRQGYTGDGYVCRSTGDCRIDSSLCDLNADCVVRDDRYVCACRAGFTGDGSRCAPEGETSSYLLYAQGMSIMQAPFKPTEEDEGKQIVISPGQTAVGIDVDCYSRYFYWTDVTGHTISRARLDGSDEAVIVTKLGSPEGVGIDWVAKNVYWTDSGLNRIEVSKTDGSNRKVLFHTDLMNPRAIVVHPIMSKLYWTDWNRKSPKIEGANMDGTNRQLLVSDGLGLPNGLTIDYDSNRLCWADAGTQNIECINFDGTGRRKIYGLASYPFDVTIANDIVYWSDWHMKSIPNMKKNGGSTNEPLKLTMGGNGKLYGMVAVKDQCPRGSNACVLNNGGCRFLCLPTPNGGRTCACPDDMSEEACNQVGLLLE